MTVTSVPERIGLRDLALRESVSYPTVLRWVREGTAPVSYRIGGRRVFDFEDVLRWEANLKADAR